MIDRNAEPTEPQSNVESSHDSGATLTAPEVAGTGLCARAQADGVPCTELGRDCHICEHAELPSDSEAW